MRTVGLLLSYFICFSISYSQFSLVNSYGDNGWVDIDINKYDELVSAFQYSSNTTYLLCNSGGDIDGQINFNYVLVALDSYGNIQPQFSSDYLEFDFNNYEYSKANDFFLTENNEIIVIGSAYDFDLPDLKPLCIQKHLSNGELDYSFGDQGTTEINLIGTYEEPQGTCSSSNGYLIWGATYDTTDNHAEFPFIVRLNEDGILDSNFASNGVLIYDFANGIIGNGERHSNGGLFRDLVELDNHQILAVGGYFNGFNYVSMMALFDEDGSIDSSFHENGIYTFEIWPYYNEEISSVQIIEGNNLLLHFSPGVEMESSSSYSMYLNLYDELTEIDEINMPNSYIFNEYSFDNYQVGRLIYDANYNGIYYSDDFFVSTNDNTNKQSFSHPNSITCGASHGMITNENYLIIGGFSEPKEDSNYSDISLIKIESDLTSVSNQNTIPNYTLFNNVLNILDININSVEAYNLNGQLLNKSNTSSLTLPENTFLLIRIIYSDNRQATLKIVSNNL